MVETKSCTLAILVYCLFGCAVLNEFGHGRSGCTLAINNSTGAVQRALLSCVAIWLAYAAALFPAPPKLSSQNLWSGMKNFHFLAVIVLIAYGFFKEFRPVLPYFNEYLTASGRNFTDELLNHEVYPIWTYSYLCFLLPVLLLSDFARHFTFVILGNCAQLGTMVSMIFGTSIVAMKFMEIFYGLATSCEISYTSFVYSMVENDKNYQKVTSWMRASILAGMSSGYATGQVLLLLGVNDLNIHAYISLATVVISFILISSLRCWPQVKHRTKPKSVQKLFPHGLLNAYLNLCKRFKSCYNSAFLAKWSIFWALSTCGHLQVSNFVQNLWSTIGEENGESVAYNGLTEAINALMGAAGAFVVQYVHLNWFVIGDSYLFLVLSLQAALLLGLSRTNNLLVAYILHVFFSFLYQTSTTISTFLIAREAPTKFHGLIFGTNTFVSLCLQTILTLIVADSSGLALPIKSQFRVYGSLYGAVGITYAGLGLYVLCKHCPLHARDLKEPGHLAIASDQNPSTIDSQAASHMITADNSPDKI